MEEKEVSLSELEARSASESKEETPEEKELKEKEARKQFGELPWDLTHNPDGSLKKVEDLPELAKSMGGGHLLLKQAKEERLTDEDLNIVALLACGIEKTKIQNIAHLDRKAINNMLNTRRGLKFTEAARKRISSLAPLAAEIIHSELVKGNLEVATQVLKGLGVLRTSVNAPKETLKYRSTAEEIIETGGKTIRRVTQERDDDY